MVSVSLRITVQAYKKYKQHLTLSLYIHNKKRKHPNDQSSDCQQDKKVADRIPYPKTRPKDQSSNSDL